MSDQYQSGTPLPAPAPLDKPRQGQPAAPLEMALWHIGAQLERLAAAHERLAQAVPIFRDDAQRWSWQVAGFLMRSQPGEPSSVQDMKTRVAILVRDLAERLETNSLPFEERQARIAQLKEEREARKAQTEGPRGNGGW